MKKAIIALGIFAWLILPKPVLASEKNAGGSAAISSVTQSNQANPVTSLILKKTVIKKVLNRYNSPLADNAEDFVKTCVKYDLDCYFLPAIAGLESTFGKFLYPNSYNPFGWGGGYILFKSWSEGIDTVGKGLRENYLNKGAQTTSQIGRIYSASPTWATRVDFLKKQFYNEEEKLQGVQASL